MENCRLSRWCAVVKDLGKREVNLFIYRANIYYGPPVFCSLRQAYVDRNTISCGELSNNNESNAEGNSEIGPICLFGGIREIRENTIFELSLEDELGNPEEEKGDHSYEGDYYVQNWKL